MRGGGEAEDRSVEKRERGKTGQTQNGRGRDAGHPARPARMRTGAFTSYGYYLGWVAANLRSCCPPQAIPGEIGNCPQFSPWPSPNTPIAYRVLVALQTLHNGSG